MTEKTLLVNPTPEVWSAHLDQIAAGTVEIVTAADFKKYPDGVLDRVITDHLTNCEVCGELPYARTEPDKKQKAMPLGPPDGSLSSSFIPAGRLGIGQIRAQRGRVSPFPLALDDPGSVFWFSPAASSACCLHCSCGME